MVSALLLSRRHISMPETSGSIRSSSTRSGSVLRHRPERVPPRADDDRRVAGLAQVVGEDLLEILLVLDDQNARHGGWSGFYHPFVIGCAPRLPREAKRVLDPSCGRGRLLDPIGCGEIEKARLVRPHAADRLRGGRGGFHHLDHGRGVERRRHPARRRKNRREHLAQRRASVAAARRSPPHHPFGRPRPRRGAGGVPAFRAQADRRRAHRARARLEQLSRAAHLSARGRAGPRGAEGARRIWRRPSRGSS